MRKVDYAYIGLLTVITLLLLLLVLKPDPKPPQPPQYSEVVCEINVTFETGVAVGLNGWSKKKKAKVARAKALKDFGAPIETKLKDGWVLLPTNLQGIICFAR